jgi:hypothetical protein
MNLDSADQALNLDARARTSGAEFSRTDGKTGECSDRTAVLVLGMHRSGTSSVAGAMVRLGGAAPLHLMGLGGPGDNEKGFWESTVFKDLNDEILAAGGSDWRDWRSFDPGQMDCDAAAALRARAKSALAEEFGDARLAIFKDPRMCRLMPFWSPVFREADWLVRPILQLRAPLEVALSLNRRDGIPLGLGCLIWLRHVLDAEAETGEMRRAVLDWNDFLGNRRRTLEQVGEQLGLAWPRWSEGALAEINEFVSADMRHHRAREDDLRVHPAVNILVRETYFAMIELVKDPSSKETRSRLDDVRSRLKDASAIFEHAIVEIDEENRRLQSTGVALRNEYTTQLTAAREELARQISEASRQLAEARSEFERQLAEARSEFERQLAEARSEFERQLAEARSEFERQLAEARSECRNLVDEAHRNMACAEDTVAYLARRYEPGGRTAPRRRFRDYLRGRPKERKELTAIRNSPFFDADFYLNSNPDVGATERDAAFHYLLHGGREGRDPSPYFSTHQYLINFPDVAESGLNALAHYEIYGRRELRRISPPRTLFRSTAS